MNRKVICVCTGVVLIGGATVLGVLAAPAGAVLQGNRNENGGRLSPASLDLDTCGCPTTFGQPVCEEQTSWTIDKTTETDKLNDPDGTPFSFTVTVTEGPTEQTLIATGQIVITNSGDQTPSLASVAVLLEDRTVGAGDAPGPSGNDWTILRIAAESEAAACGASAVICDRRTARTLVQDAGLANLILFDCDDMNDVIALSDSVEIPPTLDNDGDGLRDEDPAVPRLPDGTPDFSKIVPGCTFFVDDDGDGLIDEDGLENINDDQDGDGLDGEDPIDGIDNDGDGLIDEDPLDGIDNDGDGVSGEDDPNDDRDYDPVTGDAIVDEDGACEDAVTFCFEVVFDISGLGIEGPGDGVVPSADDLRIDLLVTFKAGGKRGGTCSADVDCDGTVEDGKGGRPDEGEGHVRTIQQRLRFDPVACDPVCECVTLTDLGAFADDPACAEVLSTTLDEEICAMGEGTVSEFFIDGTVSCACDPGGPGQPGSEPTDYTQALVPNGGADLPGGVLGVLRVDLSQGDGGFCGGSPNFVCRDDLTDNQNCDRVFIDDDGDPTFSLFRMLTFDLGSPKRGFRLYTAIDHWDGNPQSFVDGCSAGCNGNLSGNFVTQDVMEYSVWGTNVDPTADDDNNGVLDIRQMASWRLLSNVVSFDNSQATITALGHPVFGFDGADGAAAAAPVTVYINGSAACGCCGIAGNGYSRDYVFCAAWRFVGVRASSISIAQPDSDPEIDAVFGFDPEVECESDCPPCSTTVTNTAELTCEDDSLIEGSPASASFEVNCSGGDGDGEDFCSQTQGGWGQDSCNPGPDPCAGGNVGCFRDCHFDDLFPSGLVVGDPDGPDADGSFAILLTSSAAVAEYLPAGGMPAALTADQTDPETTSSGVFGGQLVAATLNVAVDDAGLRRDGAGQSCPAGTLGTLLYVAGCVDDDLVGLSVNQVIALANTAISGGGTPAGVTIGDLSDALAVLNENFVDCDTNLGCLELPAPCP